MIADLTIRTRLGAVDLVPFLRRDEGQHGVDLLDWERRPAVLALTERGWHPERIAHATGLRVADVHDVLEGKTPPPPEPTPSRMSLRSRRMAERILIDGAMVHLGAPHGTTTGYTHWGCRCDRCGDAQSLYKAMAKRALDERRAAFAEVAALCRGFASTTGSRRTARSSRSPMGPTGCILPRFSGVLVNLLTGVYQNVTWFSLLLAR